jgi:aldose 1-epimerase
MMTGRRRTQVTGLGVRAEEHRFRGQAAVRLTAGPLSATFVPTLGLTGVSLRHHGGEHVALPGGLDALRGGHTTGLPLLAPWANRLSGRSYRAAGVTVDLDGLPLSVDDNGLPIHGFLVGRPDWSVDRLWTRGDTARLRASTTVDGPAFPFPHRIEVTAIASESRLLVDTTIVPTGRRAVPIAFGWHPYLRLPGAPRSRWRLRLPSRRHLTLDPLGIPTGISHPEPAEADPIGRRTFDDGYELGRVHRLGIENDDGRSIELHCGDGYPFAQVWVPPGKTFVALEPMAAATNALVDRTAPLVARADTFTASFSLTLDHAG